MASTKALLREFGKNSASLVFPQGEDKAIALDISLSGLLSYTPPSDGWFYVRGTGTDIYADIVCGALGVISSNGNKTWGSCFYPVKKGQTIYYAVHGSVSDFWIRFIPSKLAE